MSRRVRLLLRFPDRPSRNVWLPEQPVVLIGRAEEAGCRIDHPSISRHHAELRFDDGWHVADLGSKNGTFVQGRLVSDGVDIDHGDWLRFGDVHCEFQLLGEEAARLAVESRNQRLSDSMQLQRNLNPSLGTEALVARTLDAILDLSGYERGFVLLHDGDQQWRVHAHRRLDVDSIRDAGFSGSLGAVRQCLEERSPVICNQIESDPRLANRPSIIDAGIQALLCLPLLVDAQVIGVVYVDQRQHGPPLSELDLNVLESLTSHAALALAVARMELAMSRLAGDVDRDSIWRAGTETGGDDTVVFGQG